MKPLLRKTLKPYLTYIIVVLAISIPIYYWVIDAIWEHELDEYNSIVANKTAHSFNSLQLSPTELANSLELWNRIQPSTTIRKIQVGESLLDSSFNISRKEPFNKAEKLDRFRYLSKIIYIHNQPYRFTIQTNIEETRETIGHLATITLLLVLLLVSGLLYLNRRLSQQIWTPFQKTLASLKKFQLNQQQLPAFTKSDIKEFQELNTAIETMVEHSISVYKTQKEFTENASHELQTPLAILKNKLDLLLQSEGLTEQQYQLAEEMNGALLRSTRINKNLLLLAKIENNQFDSSEKVSIDTILLQSLDTLKEYMDQKNIGLVQHIVSPVDKNASSGLTELLCNNLLLNAIRNTREGGQISVLLDNQQLEISNSGQQALDPKQLFTRFSGISKSTGGTGLGLAIVQEICKFQQWAIQYEFRDGSHYFRVGFGNSTFLQN
ncbi:MAG: HAMP domain-containing histidine kinase [Flavipsychrobacter sp.]|nr:HAMP domain-containing histidine kinase [Flavipsychrobacter sp.]